MKKGFTLVEVMIVLAIIGLLGAIVAGGCNKRRKNNVVESKQEQEALAISQSSKIVVDGKVVNSALPSKSKSYKPYKSRPKFAIGSMIKSKLTKHKGLVLDVKSSNKGVVYICRFPTQSFPNGEGVSGEPSNTNLIMVTMDLYEFEIDRSY